MIKLAGIVLDCNNCAHCLPMFALCACPTELQAVPAKRLYTERLFFQYVFGELSEANTMPVRKVGPADKNQNRWTAPLTRACSASKTLGIIR